MEEAVRGGGEAAASMERHQQQHGHGDLHGDVSPKMLWKGKSKPLDKLSNWMVEHRVGRGAAQQVTAVLLFCGGMASYLGFVLYFCVINPPQQCGKQFEDELPRWSYLLPAAAFGTAFLHNIVSVMFEKKAAKTQLAILVCYVNAVACCFEILCSLGVIPVFFTADGRPFQLMRYVMWSHATAAMVYVMSLLSDFKRADVALTVAMDVIMTVTAPLGDLTTGVARYCWWGLSFLMYPPLCYQMWCMLEAAHRAAEDASTKRAVRWFRGMTLSLWTLFPIIWTFVQAGYISYSLEEVLWSIADIFGKVLFSCSLMHTNFMTIEDRRLAAMRVIEEANRVKVIHELKELVEQKQQFIALMSHELRTPLNGIIGLSEGLLAGTCGGLDRRVAKTISAVKQSGSRLLTVINDILDAATCFKGELVVKFAKVDLAALVEDVADLTQPLLVRGVSLENRLGRKALVVAGDFNRIVQILHNLLGNAAKFTSEGQIWVDAKPMEDGEYVEVSVGDTGVGIPEDKLNTVFTSFRQVDMNLSRKYGGSGLGLSVVRQLVEAHKGLVYVESAAGKGAVFKFTLPAWREGILQQLPEQPQVFATSAAFDADPDPESESGAMSRVRRSSEFSAVFQRLQSALRDADVIQEGTESPPTIPSPLGSCVSLETNASFDYARLGCSQQQQRSSQRAGSSSSIEQGPGTAGSLDPSLWRGCSLEDAGAGPGTTDRGQALADDPRRSATGASASPSSARRQQQQQQQDKPPREAWRTGSREACSSSSWDGSEPPGAGAGGQRTPSPPDAQGSVEAQPAQPRTSPAQPSSRSLGTQTEPPGTAPAGQQPPPAEPAAATAAAPAATGTATAVERSGGGSAAGSRSVRAHPPSDYALSRSKVLSVDDDPVNQLVIRRYLQRGGYEIKQAADGQQALDILFGNGYQPDIILLDVMMPGMNGFEVCRKVRERYAPTQLPVIMVSANGMVESIQQGQEAGSNDYVTKPFSCQELLNRIEAQLRARRDEADAVAQQAAHQLLL